MALIEMISGVNFTDTTIPKLYRDAVITPGSLGCFDLADNTCWVKQANSVSGDVVKNLLDGGADGVMGTTAMAFSGGGFVTTITASERLILPAPFKLADCTGGFLVTLWFTHSAQTQATGGQIGGYANAVDNTGPWQVRWANTTGVVVTINSQNYTALGTGAISTTPHQLGLGWVPKGDGTFLRNIYLDGALLTSVAATYNTLQVPSTLPTNATLGDGMGDGTSGFYVGKFFRAWGDNLGVSLADPLALIQLDWEENNGRFS